MFSMVLMFPYQIFVSVTMSPLWNKKALEFSFQSGNSIVIRHISFKNAHHLFFFHPDYTVGFGITPNHALRLVGFTTGGELHSALKTYFVLLFEYYHSIHTKSSSFFIIFLFSPFFFSLQPISAIILFECKRRRLHIHELADINSEKP